MDCLLHTKEFKDFAECTAYYLTIECKCGISTRSYLEPSIALEQNPHLALWFYCEATPKDLGRIHGWAKTAMTYLQLNKAGYVKPCGCFEFIHFS